jgi:uncharacterized protein with NAD-binding domain and iron-sulfur cluster
MFFIARTDYYHVLLGAGVAGMIAAHELAEPGFQVRVYECNPRMGRNER